MLGQTNLYLNPGEITDRNSCFQAIEDLNNQLTMKKGSLVPDFQNGVYLWGSEEVARRILLLLEELDIPVLGIFDSDPHKHGRLMGGHEISSPRVVENYVIICSYHQPLHLESACNFLGTKALAAWELLISFPETRCLPWNNLRKPSDLSEQEKELISGVADRIHPSSREEFWRQVAARHFVGLLHSNQAGSFSNSQEYFVPGMVETKNDSIFLDLGAYTGDTIDRFFSQPVGGVDLRKAIAVEADRNNYFELMRKFSGRDEITLLNSAINHVSGLVPFSQSVNSMGSSAHFFEANTIIPAVTIDQIFERIEFSHAKFDIEGFERIALQGAPRAINEGSTTWSIASYHLYDDFWVIPSFFPDSYEIHVSRHAPLPWDTTMHFLRK
jgi:FkbM family methyltransferase